MTPGNILKDYQPKVDESNMYCKSLHSEEMELSRITPDKVYRFLYYQAYRTKKKRPKKEKGGISKKSNFLIEMTTIKLWTTKKKEVFRMLPVNK